MVVCEELDLILDQFKEVCVLLVRRHVHIEDEYWRYGFGVDYEGLEVCEYCTWG